MCDVPDKICLGHSPIPVKLVDDPDESGSYAYPEREIEIDKSLSDTNRIVTLIHEVIHDIFLTTGMNADASGPHDKLKHLTEEQIACALSQGITELLFRNPQFLKYVEAIAYPKDTA
jgi:hypothetical protein